MLTATLHFSDDRTQYYVTTSNPMHRPTFWLTVATEPGAVPDAKRAADNAFGPAYLEIRHNDGRVWYRERRDFMFWKVRASQDIEEKLPTPVRALSGPGDTKHELFADYFVAAAWTLKGDAGHNARASQQLENHRFLLADAEQTVAYHREQIALLEAEITPEHQSAGSGDGSPSCDAERPS